MDGEEIEPSVLILETFYLKVDAPVQESTGFSMIESTALISEEGAVPTIEFLRPESMARKVAGAFFLLA